MHIKQLHLINEKYKTLFANINGGMVVATYADSIDKTIVTFVSDVFTKMTGYTIEDIINLYQGRYLYVIVEEDRDEIFKQHFEQLKGGNTYHLPYRIRKKDGSIIWVMDNGYLVKQDDGFFNHSIITDISAVKRNEEELRLSENRFSIAINASSGTLFEVNIKNKLYTHFENAERIFGVKAEKLMEDTKDFSTLPFDGFVNATTNYFFHPDDRALANSYMDKLLEDGKASYEARLRRADNTYIWAKIDLSLISDEFGVPLRLVGFMSDIDEIKKRAEMLESKVKTDPMTGLYNRVAMEALVNTDLVRYPNGVHALVVLDIDNFKGVNDNLGHAFGDIVLIEVRHKLLTMIKDGDIVGRLGGDEFSIFVPNICDTASLLKQATRITKAFRQTYVGKKEDYTITCSMGIALTESATDDFSALYRKADAALYKAKESGKDQVVLFKAEDAATYPLENTRTNDEELKQLKESCNIEEYIFELLYASKDFDLNINMALAAIGQHYHVSRVVIFENDEDNDTTCNIFEWCNSGIKPQIKNLQHVNLSCGDEKITDCFDKNGLFYCNDVRELTPYIQKLYLSQGVLSTLQTTIGSDEKTYGFIGFNECDYYRVWTSEEIEKLTYLSRVLSVFWFKERAKEAVLANLNNRIKILDVLPDYICVVNPSTHSIEYANKKMKELLPDAYQGAFCFNTLRGGQGAPCPECL
ncbi:MAG: diguanylate cyclase, partial [Clostridia bacterium]